MCGIIGYVGWRDPNQVLADALRRLEYRGYDSAGVAWIKDGGIERIRTVGNLDALELALRTADAAVAVGVVDRGQPDPSSALTQGSSSGPQIGIGHTRWATHGGVSELNAHPHSDVSGEVMIVLNGIIENHHRLRELLHDNGIDCVSETDAEVAAQLIGLANTRDLAAAVRVTIAKLEGHYALVALSAAEPDTLVCYRHECPLVLGLGDGERFVASSITAFLPYTHRAVILNNDQLAVIRRDELSVTDARGTHMPVSVTDITWEQDDVGKLGFESFMLKEIHEQGAAIRATLAGARSQLDAAEMRAIATAASRGLDRIVVVACGTSYHAGLAAKLAIERWAKIPVEVDVASEFRYREPVIRPGTLVIGITQSGETADTLAAMRTAGAAGATVVALTNSPGSQATREADAVLLTQAGTEIGVAASKTFVAQVSLLFAFALRLAVARESLPADAFARLEAQLKLLPDQVDAVVDRVGPEVRAFAEELASSPLFLYLGRLSGLPVALEGALKLKEISYIPTEAYAAGEMKHGPIALLSQRTPVICVATEAAVLPKLLSNIAEVKARGARVLAVAVEGFAEIGEYADDVIYVPPSDPLLEVTLAIVPLQLFAYHVARARGLSVDQPRNLAKTVTVE
jgi:glucosamine--fructose-6-phosphate aminotransferase (isomerizing)